MDPTTASLLAFFALMLLVLAVALVMRDLRAQADGAAVAVPVIGRLPLARDDRPAANFVESLDHGFARLVVESGLMTSPIVVVMMLIVSGLLFGGGMFLWFDEFIPGVVGFVAGMLLPLPILVVIRNIRAGRMQHEFADVLDLLSRGIKAGESLDQAIDMVGQRGPEPLATEFRRCARHLQLGAPLSAAMRSFTYRVRVTEAKLFSTTLLVHRQTGGNLPLMLDRMADVIRDRLAYRQQLRSTSAAGRFSALFVAVLGPLLFLYLFMFQPQYANKLLESSLGESLLGVAIVLEIIGVVWILRMLRPTY